MSKESWSWTLNRTLSNEPSLAAVLIKELCEHLTDSGWGDKDVFGIHMGVEEAIMNAIKHGNCRDETKSIKVSIAANDETFWARIEDEGEGFVLDDVPDPTLDENLEKGSGRGVMLMRAYMDQVSYNERGNVVEMRKSRTAP